MEQCPITPFSPFTVALHNIRQNVLTKRYNTLKDKDIIENAFLEEMITFKIPIGNLYIEFPAAAFIRKGEPEPNIKYRGDFSREISQEGKQEKSYVEIKICDVINKFKSGNCEFEIYEKELQRFPFDGIKESYPATLRNIDGLIKIEVSPNLSCILMFQTSSPNIQYNGIIDIMKVQLSFFLKQYEDIDKLIQRRISYTSDDYLSVENKDLPYPGLRQLLSSIQQEAETIVRTDNCLKKVTFESKFEKAFNIVFVRPTINTQGKYCFQYFLTHQQISILDEMKSKNRDELKKLIKSREKQSQEYARKEYNKVLEQHHIPIVNNDDQTESISNMLYKIKTMTELDKNTTNTDFDLYLEDCLTAASPDIDELLRDLILLDYAYKDETVDKFLTTCDDLTYNIESDKGCIEPDNTFLITEVFKSKGVDIVEKIINHPGAKYKQQSDTLKKLISSDAEPYPSFLHLFETLILSNRLFMYPLYQYDSPLLLCAFNDHYFSEVRTDLKGSLDKNIHGIFNSILEYELSETSRIFSAGNLEEVDYIPHIIARIKLLVSHFCTSFQDLKNPVLENYVNGTKEEKRGVWEDEKSKELQAIIHGLSIPRKLKIATRSQDKSFITDSKEGKLQIKFYLMIYMELISLILNSKRLIKSNISSMLKTAVAHTIKNALLYQSKNTENIIKKTRNNQIQRALLLNYAQQITFLFLSMFQQLRQSLINDGDKKEYNVFTSLNDSLHKINVPFLDLIKNTYLHSTLVSGGVFDQIMLSIPEQDLSTAELYCKKFEESITQFRSYFEKISNGKILPLLDEESIDYFINKLKKLELEIYVQGSEQLILNCDIKTFAHLYTAFLEIFGNSLKYGDKKIFIDFKNMGNEGNCIIQITSTDNNNKIFFLNNKELSFDSLKVNYYFESSNEGDGMMIIRESLKQINGNFGVVDDDSIKNYCTGFTFYAPGENNYRYFWREVSLPNSLFILRRNLIQ